MKWVAVILAALVGVAVWVRVAPSDPSRWHVPIRGEGDADFEGGVRRVVGGDSDVMARLEGLILATARTRVLAGSVDEGRVTYVTRSALWGFPDYTTVELRKGEIAILGRLRFGRSDLGVNKARVEGWLQALAQG